MTKQLGCYFDETKERDLSAYKFIDDAMTPEMCVNKCADLGFKYAGVQFE